MFCSVLRHLARESSCVPEALRSGHAERRNTEVLKSNEELQGNGRLLCISLLSPRSHASSPGDAPALARALALPMLQYIHLHHVSSAYQVGAPDSCRASCKTSSVPVDNVTTLRQHPSLRMSHSYAELYFWQQLVAQLNTTNSTLRAFGVAVMRLLASDTVGGVCPTLRGPPPLLEWAPPPTPPAPPAPPLDEVFVPVPSHIKFRRL